LRLLQLLPWRYEGERISLLPLAGEVGAQRRMRAIGVKRAARLPSPAPLARPLPQAGEANNATHAAALKLTSPPRSTCVAILSSDRRRNPTDFSRFLEKSARPHRSRNCRSDARFVRNSA
jgi:hypothetical protein